MLNSDARKNKIEPEHVIADNEAINNEVISEIEKELMDNPYDLVSLVFLLYEVPDTALQKLIVFQRISKDASCSTNLNMLHEWFQHAKNSANWKNEFIESLTICQLNSIIRKLGFHVPTIKQQYAPANICAKTNVNPLKKVLYKLCENMDSNSFMKFKKTLLTYGMNTMAHESCELVLLELMCQKFITLSQYQYDKKVFGYRVQIDKLIKIIESLPGLREIASDLNNLQRVLNDESKPNLPTQTPSIVAVNESEKPPADDKYFNHNFEDLYELIGNMHLDESGNDNFKCDTIKLGPDSYEIKNPKRVGVCAIINQEDFYPSKNSIESTEECIVLERRLGSDKDKATIEKTMKSLNFDVFSKTNIDHKEMFEFINDIVHNKFTKDDSILMLCILSHGVRGHVYAADSVKVKMDDIQNLIDSDDAVNLHNKPKLIIVQACQVEEAPLPALVADSPKGMLTKKTNFLIYWATAPELEAYRSERQGSVFIQLLCKTIAKQAKKDHVVDIFTNVTHNVTHLCTRLKYVQVPLFQSTLMKKLYLQIPQK